ncbi:MAG: peroxidase-related enzyme, partial [Janthinobacterium lividum]
GTSATIGRYCRYQQHATRLAVADPEGSAFAQAWRTGSREVTAPGSRIEGIGRPRVEPSFVPSVIDEMFTVPDGESVAAMRMLFERTGIRAGASTGTNLSVALRLVDRMRRDGQRGSVVTLICDDGNRYLDTYYSDDWLRSKGIDVAAGRLILEPLFGSSPDDLLTGTDPLAPLAVLREDVRAATLALDDLVLRPVEDRGLARVERLRIALRVAQVNEHAELAVGFAAELTALGSDPEPVGDPSRRQECGPAAVGLLRHAERLSLAPHALGRADVETLAGLGLGAAQVVAAVQVAAYVNYLARLLQGLGALDATATGTTTRALDPPRISLPALEASQFPNYRWVPWIAPVLTSDNAPTGDPGDDSGDEPDDDVAGTPLSLVLRHDPGVLAEGTVLYNAIMTGCTGATGALARADRELTARATSLTNGGEYCASVHGHRQVQLSADPHTAAVPAGNGPADASDPLTPALIHLAAHAATIPPTIGTDDVDALRAAGLGLDGIRDAVCAAAMAGWTNRLVLSLGEVAL